MSVREGRKASFGPFVVDFHAEEISRDGYKIKLQAQPLHILAILLEKPGELVTREELRHRIWPEDTFVDFEHSLNTAIKKLRHALGDIAEKPIYIETLPKRGYRFIGPVNGSPRINQDREQQSGRGWAGWRTALLLGVIGAGLGGWYYFSHRLPPAAVIHQLVTEPGDVGVPAFSPGGDRVVFHLRKAESESWDLYVKSVSQSATTKLTSRPGKVMCPRWSPDGRYIGFLRLAGEESGIYVIPSDGGSERKLVALHSYAVGGFDWTPDGRSIIYADAEKPDRVMSLHRLQLDTFADVVLDTGGQDPTQPLYSPDGRWIAMGYALNPVSVIPAGGGKARVLTTKEDTFNWGHTWTADSKEVVFSSVRSGAMGLWRIPASGGKARPVLLAGEPQEPMIAPKQNRMAYLSSAPPVTAIYRLDLPTKENRTPGAPRKLIYSNELDEGGQISPDGKRIAFQSTRSDGHYEIWVADADGSNAVQLTNFRGGMVGTPRWSPDGNWIAFARDGTYVIRANGGVARKLPTCLGIASWSRDGKSVYCAGPPASRFEIWRVSVQGTDSRQVTRNGGVNAVESKDGKYIYYTKWNTPGLFRATVAGGEEVKLLDDPPAKAWGYFALVEDGVYYLTENLGPAEESRYWITFLEFSSMKSSKVVPIRHKLWLVDPGFSVSPDRTWMIYRGVDRDYERHLMLMENFR